MQDLNITLIQTTQVWENIEANLLHFENIGKKVDSSDLILLPEMFSTGFTMNTDKAEEWHSSKALDFLKSFAESQNAAVYTSILIKENGHYFNRGVFIHPNGEIECYDKRKTFGLAGEDKVIQAGTEKKIVRYKGWSILLQICYDLRFPEMARNKINADGIPEYDLLLYVANWPQKRIHHWSKLLVARAIENQCFVAALNRVGHDENDIAYNGQSVIIDHNGETLLFLNDADMPASNKISMSELSKFRTQLPFLKDISKDS